MRTRELLRRYAGSVEFCNKFVHLFSCKDFFGQGIRKKAYTPDAQLTSAIAFTAEGEKLVDTVQGSHGVSLDEARFIVFLVFAHDELLVEVEETDTSTVEKVLNAELLSGKIRFPWVFEHELYDRAFQLFPHLAADDLTASQTEDLLRDTSPGVFQLGTLVVGPFGLLHSLERRWCPPVRQIALSHCSDPTCGHVHYARLAQLDSKLHDIRAAVQDALEQERGPSSTWYGFFSDLLLPQNYYYDETWYGKVMWLLANGFSKREMERILLRALERSGKAVRQQFPADDFFSTSNEKLVSKMTKSQMLQCLCLAGDDVIIAAVDETTERVMSLFPLRRSGRRWLRSELPVGSVTTLSVQNWASEL